MPRTIKILTGREHYAAGYSTVIRQLEDDQITTLQIRRVVPSGKAEEVQIEINIQKIGQKRNQQMHSSFVVPAAIGDVIASACAFKQAKDVTK